MDSVQDDSASINNYDFVPEDSSRRQKKENNTLWKEFFKSTSLHGFKYISNASSHWIERSFWCLVLISFSVSLFRIFGMKVSQWKESPITIEVEYTPRRISTLPFPAVTFCGTTYFFWDNVDFYLEYPEKVDALYKVAEILGVTNEELNEKFKINQTHWTNENRIKISDLTFVEMFNSLMFPKYALKNNIDFETRCYYTYTFKGLCTSCNMFPPSKIYKNNTMHHFFFEDNNKYEYNNDTIHGFPSLMVDDIIQKYPSLIETSRTGFTVTEPVEKKKSSYAIHNPWDVPSPYMRWYNYNHFRHIQVNIDPEQTIQYPIDDDFMNKISPNNQCYTATGKKLDFFQYYTRQNCLLECFSKKAIEKCGCVLLYMPHNETTYICPSVNHSCVSKVAMIDHYDISDENSVYSCDCLPSCNDTEYKIISIEKFPIDYETTLSFINFLKISFRDDLFYPKIRTYTYNKYDIIESSVFYLDLFLGVSLNTIIEILYFIGLYVIVCFKRLFVIRIK